LASLPDSIRCRIRYSSASYADIAVMPTMWCERAAGLAGSAIKSA
jgi:hypothetical protein